MRHFVMICGLVSVLLAGCGGGSSAGSGDQKKRAKNLKLVSVLMYNHHDMHGSFPVRRKARESSDVRFPLSWRVYCLEMGLDAHRGLWERFDPHSSWDSPKHRSLVAEIPPEFSGLAKGDDGKSTLHVFVDNGAPFTTGTKPDEVYGPALFEFKDGDGRENTILVVEAGPEAAVEWTKPGGIEFDPENPKQGLGTLPEDGFLVIMADGSVWRLPRNIPDEQLKALITLQGGETIGPSDVTGAVRLHEAISF